MNVRYAVALALLLCGVIAFIVHLAYALSWAFSVDAAKENALFLKANWNALSALVAGTLLLAALGVSSSLIERAE